METARSDLCADLLYAAWEQLDPGSLGIELAFDDSRVQNMVSNIRSHLYGPFNPGSGQEYQMSQPPPSAWWAVDRETHDVPEPRVPAHKGRLDDGLRFAEPSDASGHHTRVRKRRTVEHIRIRVNAQGLAYVEGLERGHVYDAHIKPQWPDTVWLENTGLSHSCFLFTGMYEIVEAAHSTNPGATSPT
jgi:hypothetical protein